MGWDARQSRVPTSQPVCYVRPHSQAGRRTIRLFNDQTGEFLGDVSEEDVEFLVDQLEEEFEQDRAYYVNQDSLTMLRANGASQELLAALERAVGPTGEADVTWSEA